MKQKAEVTVETQETLVLRQSAASVTEFCPLCEAEIDLLTPEVLAALAGCREREIFRLLETGTIHFVERKRTYACPQCYERALTATEPREAPDREVRRLDAAQIANTDE